MSAFTSVCLSLYLFVGLAAAEQKGSLRILDLPDTLVLPLPAGTNKTLAVKAAGAKVRSVWLAKGRNSTVRATLTAAGGGTFEINLGDVSVVKLLETKSPQGQFRFFAETDGGDVIESVAVNYAFKQPSRSDIRLLVHRADDREAMAISGRSNQARWLRPEEVRGIELEKSADDDAVLVCRVGETRFEGMHDEGENARIDATRKLRDSWKKEGVIRIAAERDGNVVMDAKLLAIPDELRLGDAIETMTIIQRQGREIPGSNGYLRVEIGDITANQVLLRMATAEEKKILDWKSVTEGDHLEFKLGDRSYFLSIDRLVNILIGHDDFAEISVHDKEPLAHHTIERLLRRLEVSPHRFIREGKPYTGREAGIHLRMKYRMGKERIKSVDEFIEKIASKSQETGAPYEVEIADGDRINAEDWWREQLREIEKPAVRPEQSQE